jgi:murein DD-endopeptidase MepM/ murein hydrolase activator NlpD
MASQTPLEPPFSNLGGNHVILDCGGYFPLYAHLRQGTVSVKVGDVVKEGDLIGRVGNSGASLQPHLHFQVMSSFDPFPLFENLLPFTFRPDNPISGDAASAICPATGASMVFSETFAARVD